MPTTRVPPDPRAQFQAQALIHLDALYAAGIRLTRNPAEAEDLVQETMLRAWKNWAQFEAGTHCRAWLLRILRNTFINGYRRRRREREILTAEREQRLSDRFYSQECARTWADPVAGYERRNLSPIVDRALASLRPEFRMVVELSDLQSLSYREVAEIVGCPVGTVMSRLFRARRQLRDRLRDHAREHGLEAVA